MSIDDAIAIATRVINELGLDKPEQAESLQKVLDWLEEQKNLLADEMVAAGGGNDEIIGKAVVPTHGGSDEIIVATGANDGLVGPDGGT
jgi:hypothetical protein